MTSPANEMHIFLWQIGTVIPIQSMIIHIYIRWVLITIRLGFVIIYLNQRSERNMIDIPGSSERTNFKSTTVFRNPSDKGKIQMHSYHWARNT
jgi:hypothetical protein